MTHSLTALKDGVDRVIFDSSYLSIKRCFVVAEGGQEELTFDLSKRHKSLGSALTVQLPKALKEGNKCELKIEYGTTDSCTALGWLTAEQTDSGKYPFLYSQCQAIHCRSLIRTFTCPEPFQTTAGRHFVLNSLPRHPFRQAHLLRRRALDPSHPPLCTPHLASPFGPSACH